MPDLADFCTPIRSGLGSPRPARALLSAARAQQLHQDLAVLAAERRRALVASQEYVIAHG